MSLTINQLAAGYGPKPVLKNLTIPDIARGSFIGLIGPNASGKSTLFKTIAGMVARRGGSIFLDGADLTGQSRKARAQHIAYMPQAFGCNAVLTVFESVLLALKQSSGWRVKEHHLDEVSAVLSRLGLGHLSERGIADLSGGQAQMVAVAQVLVRAPDVILLDEPTSALDLHHQLSIMTSVRAEARRRRCVVMAALHDLNLAAKYCDRLVLLRDGEIHADGAPAAVLALSEIGETYRVETSLEQTGRGAIYVDARLPS